MKHQANMVKTCMPPDPNPIKPKLKLPAQSCDAHCHVFGPSNLFPYHPSASYNPPDAGKEKLKALHDYLGIERAVIVQASCHGPDNSAMVDALKWANGKWRGVCIANNSFSVDDFKSLDEVGVKGIRFNFVKHLGGAPDLGEMKKVLDKVIPLGWHLVIHVNAEDLIQYQKFFESLGDLNIVVDHMGRVPTDQGVDQSAFQILLAFLAKENWWSKVSGAERISNSGPPFYDAVPYAQALINIAPDRILWGTDFPHPNIKTHMPNDGALVDLLSLYSKDKEVLHKILVDNPTKLYKWDE